MKKTQETMVVQNYPMTILRTTTLNHHFRTGETRQGTLTMREDVGMEVEHFEFREKAPDIWQRNPKVWEGAYINVHCDKNGHYQVHLKKMELSKRFPAMHIGDAIRTELLTAKKVLGL